MEFAKTARAARFSNYDCSERPEKSLIFLNYGRAILLAELNLVGSRNRDDRGAWRGHWLRIRTRIHTPTVWASSFDHFLSNFVTRRAAVLLFLLCLTTAFVLTHLPGGTMPKVRWVDWIPASDKIVHSGLYYFLAAFLANCLRFRVQSNRVIVVTTMAVLAGYAAFDEWSQQFSPHRYPDFADFIADMIGAWFGVSTFVVCRWYRQRRRQRVTVLPSDGSELEPDSERPVRPAGPSVGSSAVKVHSPA